MGKSSFILPMILRAAFAVALVVPANLTAGTVVSVMTEPDNPNIPAGATPQSCYAREIMPAIIETVTEQIPLTPPRLKVDKDTGQTVVVKPATYDTITVQRIVRDRQETWFETICPHLYTERFVKSLQRALKARGFYSGTLSGWMDQKTNIAIKLYQRGDNINSEILALKTAEAFGLISHRDFNEQSRDN